MTVTTADTSVPLSVRWEWFFERATTLLHHVELPQLELQRHAEVFQAGSLPRADVRLVVKHRRFGFTWDTGHVICALSVEAGRPQCFVYDHTHLMMVEPILRQALVTSGFLEEDLIII